MGSIWAAWILSCVVLFGHTVYAWNYPSLTPPIGNSLMMKTKTDNGKQIYKCISKEWVFIGSAADLVLADNKSVKVGVHTSQPAEGRTLETWTFQNSKGDAAESGAIYSSVSGEEIFSVGSDEFISEALLQATSHKAQGKASLVSYVQRLFLTGGLPMMKEACDQESAVVELPYEAQFWIWRQDLEPPSTIPSSLAVFSERAVQGLYGQGTVVYRFTEELKWEKESAEAKLYNVPGGLPSGNYSSTFSSNAGEVHDWKFSNPNGFHIVGKLKSNPVSIDRHALPWSLVAITSHSGNVSVVGDYSHVQIVSTRGGLPSSILQLKPVPGLVWKAPFSAIFWFYSH